VERKREWKDTLYGGFFAFGELMHPVLFTSDRKDSKQLSPEMPVVYQPSMKGPGSLSTEAWWNIVGQLDFPEGGVVMVDHLRGHFSKTLQQEMQDLDVALLHYPKFSGALLDPCDNSWFADLKRRYYRKDRTTHGLMIQAIREAVYETDESSLKHYWHHCGYTSEVDSKMVIASLAGEGFEINSRYNDDFTRMKKIYRVWKKSWDDHQSGLPLTPVSSIKDKNLVHQSRWSIWNRK
jgi:hypothetical protein